MEWTTDGVEIAAGRKKNWSGKRKMNQGVDFATKIATGQEEAPSASGQSGSRYGIFDRFNVDFSCF